MLVLLFMHFWRDRRWDATDCSVARELSVSINLTKINVTSALTPMTGGLILFVIVGWKPYNYFWGRNINLSGISPAKRSRSRPNSVYVDIPGGGNVQGILGAIGPFWAKWGLGRSSLAEPQFFGLVNHATFRQLRNGRFSPNLVTKRISVSRRRIRKDIFENFHFRGHFPPISDFEIRSNRHLTWSRIQVKGCM